MCFWQQDNLNVTFSTAWSNVLARKNTDPSSLFVVFWRITFLNPREVPSASFPVCSILIFCGSFSLCLSLIFLPQSWLLKNNLVICLSHSDHLPSGSSLPGTDVIRVCQNASSEREKAGRLPLSIHRKHRHQQCLSGCPKSPLSVL